MCLSFQCEFEKALSHLEKCLDLSELADNPTGILISKPAIAQIYYMEGNIGLACQLGKEVSHLAKKSGDVYIKGWADTQYGCALYYKGEIEKAEEYLLNGLTYSQQTSVNASEAWASWVLGNLCFELGKYGEADKYYIDGAKALESVNMLPSWINTMKICSVRAGIHIKGVDTNCHNLFECFEKNKLKVCEGIMAMNIGDILLQSSDGQMADSEAWIKKAIYADTKNGTRLYLAADYVLYAEWFKKKGDPSGAREQLASAIEIFRECGADGWVEKYERELVLLTQI
jgi:tetratricopeptide (TPR) repeat protein